MRKLRLRYHFVVMMINIYVIALSIVCKLKKKFEDLISFECMHAALVQISIRCLHVLAEKELLV